RHNFPGAGIDRRERACRPAVIGEDDLVVRFVVHDAVEPRADLDLLDYGQRLQVEHRDGLIAAVGREAVAGFGRDPGAVHAGCVRDVPEDFAGRAFDDHHVRRTGYEHASRGSLDGDVVRAALAFDVELLDLEGLRVPD